jgi:ArsR family transcriptional regulator, arsenate/arsenite/antimonite-responsive transcriptional repressor
MTPDPASDNHPKPSAKAFSHLAQVLSLLADETRLRMVMALARDGEVGVNALAELVGKRQPLVSRNLTLLRMAGLVSYRDEGAVHLYRLEWGTLRYVLRRFFAEMANGGKELRLGDCSLEFLHQ